MKRDALTGAVIAALLILLWQVLGFEIRDTKEVLKPEQPAVVVVIPIDPLEATTKNPDAVKMRDFSLIFTDEQLGPVTLFKEGLSLSITRQCRPRLGQKRLSPPTNETWELVSPNLAYSQRNCANREQWLSIETSTRLNAEIVRSWPTFTTTTTKEKE